MRCALSCSRIAVCKKREESYSRPLSHSSMLTFMRCKRMFFHAEVCRLQTKEVGTALQLGRFASDMLDCIHAEAPKELPSLQDILNQHREVKPSERALVAGEIKAHHLFARYAQSEEGKVRGDTQHKWETAKFGVPLKGFIDLLTKDAVYEFKYTSFPETYNAFTVFDQLALYCMATGRKRGVIRCFDKTIGPRPFRTDTVESYAERCADWFSKTKHPLFIDTTLYRADLKDVLINEIRIRIQVIHRHLQAMFAEYEKLGIAAFYQERHSCFLPFKCDYYSICETGVVSGDIYETKESKQSIKEDTKCTSTG